MKQEKFLHIVSFNVPYPPNYGGIIDIYFKLKALSSDGIKIILHTFTYGREPSKELEALAYKVYYYKRKKSPGHLVSKLPYIVLSRSSTELKENLLSDNYPVLFEGIHTTIYLNECKNAGKKVFVRTHNIEHKYYSMLADSTRNIFKKIYLKEEARRLRKFEPILANADQLFSISTTDTNYFYEHYQNSLHVSAFHQLDTVHPMPGKGKYLLFHGNLAVPENENAVLYLVKNVLSKLEYSVIIAGKDPGNILKRVCNRYSHVELISNPDNDKMHDLVCKAHINLLYTYQPTGLKLKLLHSLYAGRFCLANPLMISGSGLEDLCVIYRSPAEAIEKIEQLMQTDFDEETVQVRAAVLSSYNNNVIAKKIIDFI